MEYVYKFFKICLFVFNTFYFLIGIGMILIAAFLYFSPNQLNELIKADFGMQYMNLIYFLMIFGIFLIFVGFVGCTGILSEKGLILFSYFTLLFIIFALQFSGAVYFYIKSVDYFKLFQGKVLQAIKSQYANSPVHTRALDFMHYNYKCCGWNSPRDWINSSYIDPKYAFKSNEQLPANLNINSPYNSIIVYKIPHSCCVSNYDLTCVIMHKFHEVGCENIIKNYYKQIEIYVAWAMASLNIFQLLLLVLSLYLICILFFEKKPSFKRKLKEDDDRLYMTSYYL